MAELPEFPDPEAAELEAPDPEDLAPPFAFGSVLWLVGALACGGVMGLVVLPYWLPGLEQSLRSEVPHAPWYISRASGVVALVLLWASTCTGLLLSARVARDLDVTPAVLDLHQHLALSALGFALVHAGVLLMDEYIGFGALELVFPFSTRRFKPLAMGLGQLGFYCAVVGTLSFYARRDLGKTTWHGLHVVGSVAFLLALLHGVYAGSSAELVGLRIVYWFAGGTVLLLVFYRLLSRHRC